MNRGLEHYEMNFWRPRVWFFPVLLVALVVIRERGR